MQLQGLLRHSAWPGHHPEWVLDAGWIGELGAWDGERRRCGQTIAAATLLLSILNAVLHVRHLALHD